ncbi:MAG TPA: HAD family hydrolase [Candidatus Dormibacteraeota bacterium]
MAFRAVLFDFGQTLFQAPDAAGVMVEAGVAPALAERLWQEIWARALTAEELAKGRDLSEEAHRRHWLELLAAAEPHAPGISARLYEAVMRIEAWIPFPDTADVLAALDAAGVRVGIVSNTAMPLRAALDAHGLSAHVEACIESYTLGIEKPDPRIFAAACAALGCEPAETLMVGDSHLADGAGVLGGLTVLLLPPVPRGAARGLDAVLDLLQIRRPAPSQ